MSLPCSSNTRADAYGTEFCELIVRSQNCHVCTVTPLDVELLNVVRQSISDSEVVRVNRADLEELNSRCHMSRFLSFLLVNVVSLAYLIQRSILSATKRSLCIVNIAPCRGVADSVITTNSKYGTGKYEIARFLLMEIASTANVSMNLQRWKL